MIRGWYTGASGMNARCLLASVILVKLAKRLQIDTRP